MREILECAVLSAPGHIPPASDDWMPAGDGRIKLHPFPLDLSDEAGGNGTCDPSALILEAALRLQRFDACLLLVEPGTLPWARTALARARPMLRTPMLVLAREFKAGALVELLDLGAADFLRAPLCLEELRARVLRLAGRPVLNEPIEPYGGGSGAAGFLAAQRASSGWAVADASRPRFVRARQRRCARDNQAQACEPAESLDQPFNQVKARVVEGFERDYVRRMLALHHGNVTRAARSASKHRRAFWALMHKHGIEAAPYRAAARAARNSAQE